jgi:hypothetical protein
MGRKLRNGHLAKRVAIDAALVSDCLQKCRGNDIECLIRDHLQRYYTMSGSGRIDEFDATAKVLRDYLATGVLMPRRKLRVSIVRRKGKTQ